MLTNAFGVDFSSTGELESPTFVDVYFDDVKFTHTKTNVIQYNEYYPFGLQTSTTWTRENTKDNNYLYNAANELNKTSGWYEMFYRGYDPAIGRMLQVDPYAPMYASTTTYNFAMNNPVMMNDPSGGQAHDDVDRLPAWGSQRIGYGSGNHWSEGIGYDGWSLDGRSETFDEMMFGGFMPTGGGGFFVKGKQMNDPSQFGGFGESVGYWKSNDDPTGSYYDPETGYTVPVWSRPTFVKLIDKIKKKVAKFFRDHYRGEAEFELSYGAQATFAVTDGAIAPAPYIKQFTPGFSVNLASRVLLAGKASVNGKLEGKAEITKTFSDDVFTHGISGSYPGVAGEWKLTHSNGSVLENKISFSLGGIATKFDTVSGELSIGIEANAKFALILGGEGSINQMLVFNVYDK